MTFIRWKCEKIISVVYRFCSYCYKFISGISLFSSIDFVGILERSLRHKRCYLIPPFALLLNDWYFHLVFEKEKRTMGIHAPVDQFPRDFCSLLSFSAIGYCELGSTGSYPNNRQGRTVAAAHACLRSHDNSAASTSVHCVFPSFN